MRNLIIIVFLLSTICSYSQTFSDDKEFNLDKFSYMLVGIKTVNGEKKIFPKGTCFFSRRGNELFLITAKHNINGYNTFNKNPTSSQFDTIGFRYFNSRTSEICFSSLNILQIKKSLPNDFFFQSPDLVVLLMNDPTIEKFIYSMETYIFENVKEGEILDSVLAIGYAVQEPTEFSSTTPVTYYKGVTADLQHKDPIYPVNDSLYYIVQPKTIQGMSGSPVFLKYRSKRVDTKEHILFGGVLFGTNAKYNSTYIVNPDIVRYQLREFISSKK